MIIPSKIPRDIKILKSKEVKGLVKNQIVNDRTRMRL